MAQEQRIAAIENTQARILQLLEAQQESNAKTDKIFKFLYKDMQEREHNEQNNQEDNDNHSEGSEGELENSDYSNNNSPHSAQDENSQDGSFSPDLASTPAASSNAPSAGVTTTTTTDSSLGHTNVDDATLVSSTSQVTTVVMSQPVNTHYSSLATNTITTPSSTKSTVASTVALTPATSVANLSAVAAASKQSTTSTAVNLPEEEDEYASLQEDYSKPSKVSDDTKQNLAAFVNKAITHNMDSEKLKTLQDKYAKIPANIPYLVAPRCNKEIFSILNTNTTQRDTHIQKQQSKLITGIVPLVKAMEMNVNKEVGKLLKDSFQLLAQAHMDLNNDRKARIKPELGNVKHLAYKDSVITEELFGNNIEAECKKAETSSKLSETIKIKDLKRKADTSQARTPFKKQKTLQQRFRDFYTEEGGKNYNNNNYFNNYNNNKFNRNLPSRSHNQNRQDRLPKGQYHQQKQGASQQQHKKRGGRRQF